MIRPRRISAVLALAITAVMALTSVGLAVALKKGGSYAGQIVQGHEPITVKVSSSGKTAKASVQFAPIFCEGGGAGERQLAKPAPISKAGKFREVISYEFVPTHKVTGKLYVKGTFKGKKLTGTARSEFLLAKQCDGSARFSASAK
jgi:hypothetical protein